jgi:hypothetical protein
LIKIDGNIPIPTSRSVLGISAAMRALKVGESFAVDAKHASACRTTVQRFSPAKFITRIEDGKIRVWRVE